MLLPSRYCSQAECKDVLLLCLSQTENEAFSETASFRVDRLLHFFSGSLGSDATNERLELRGFLPLGSFSWVHYLFSQPKKGKENNLWDRDGSWLVMAKESFPPQLLIGSAVFLGCFLKVGKEAIIPFLFIYLPRGCRAFRKDGDKSGDFPPPSWFFQPPPPPPSFTYLAVGWFLFSARKLQSISMHECSPASIHTVKQSRDLLY